MSRHSRRIRPQHRQPEPPVDGPSQIPARGLKIGEAARLIGVEAYVLRFWETQFSILKPVHTQTKHRFYHARDIEILKLIKHLLHDQGFTIAGANRHIREAGLDSAEFAKSPPGGPPIRERPTARTRTTDPSVKRTLAALRRDLESLHKLLEG